MSAKRRPSYLANVLMGLDQFLSVLTGGLPGETLSGRAGSALLEGKLRGRIFAPVIDRIMYWSGAYPFPRGHCIHAVEGDIQRSRAVIADQARAWRLAENPPPPTPPAA